jgi:hypothetical protein
MKQIKRFENIILFSILVIVLSVLRAVSAWSQTDESRGVTVGRITTIEGGQLLRYVPPQKDWVVTVKDAPFAPTDALYSGDDTKAEFIIPDNSMIRVGGDTQLELMQLDRGVTQADAASGKVRFWNKSGEGVVRVTTPYGYVVGPAGTVFDIYVGDKTLEVVSLQGTVDFIHDADQARYQVTAGSSSVIANGQIVTSGPGETAEAWEQWNESRDGMIAKRNEAASESAQRLPHELQDYRSDLDQNGRWETVSYQDKSYNLWRPTGVKQDWAPFTDGAWMDYDGDNAWVPEEPFGYVTMHYGNWLWVDNGWFWAPPGIGIGISSGCDFCWFPGRVGWLYTDEDVGWFPLAPAEPFYALNPWGLGTVVVSNLNINNINLDINNFQFVNHAVIVNQNSLFVTNNYYPMLKSVSAQSIAANFHAAPVLSGTVIKNYLANAQRFTVGGQAPAFKPRPEALTRIENNVKQASLMDAKTIQGMVAAAKPGQISQSAKLSPPSIGGELVNKGGVKVAGAPAGRTEGTQAAGLKTGQPHGQAQESVQGKAGGAAASSVSKSGRKQIARPQKIPLPTAAEKAAKGHSVRSVSKTAKSGREGTPSHVAKARSHPQGRTRVAGPQRSPRPTAAERTERANGRPSALEVERELAPRSGITQSGSSRSSGIPSASESSAAGQQPRSFTERRSLAQTPTRDTDRPGASFSKPAQPPHRTAPRTVMPHGRH